MKDKMKIIAAGLTIGLTAICLAYCGNPANMAICIACFIRDTAGALGLHSARQFQYIRPEIIGIVFGAFIVGIIKREHAPKGGSSPLTRFVLGICVMVGALVFLGCPMRMILRIAGGDLNAVIGLAGFSAGIMTGILFLNRGFSLKRSYDQPAAEGFIPPVAAAVSLVLLIAAAQRSRLCFIAGLRDAVLFRDFRMLLCFGSVLLGGCPLRQLVMASGGNGEYTMTLKKE